LALLSERRRYFLSFSRIILRHIILGLSKSFNNRNSWFSSHWWANRYQRSK